MAFFKFSEQELERASEHLVSKMEWKRGSYYLHPWRDEQERQEDQPNRTWYNAEEAKLLHFSYPPRTNELTENPWTK